MKELGLGEGFNYEWYILEKKVEDYGGKVSPNIPVPHPPPPPSLPSVLFRAIRGAISDMFPTLV